MRTKVLSIVAAFVALMLLPAMTWALKIKDVKGEYNGREIDVTGKNVGSITVGSNITIKIKTDKKFKKAEIKFHHLPNSFNLDKKNDDESVKFNLGPFNDPGERNFTVKVFKDKKDKKADDTFDGRFYVAGNQSTPKPPKPPVPPPVPPGDKEKPRLHSFAPNKSTIRVGETVEISYTVSDVGGSGLRQVELWRGKEKGNLGHYKTDTIKGNGPVSGKFTDSPSPAGTYYYGIHVLDNKDNFTYDNGALPVSVAIDSNKTVPPPGLIHPINNQQTKSFKAVFPLPENFTKSSYSGLCAYKSSNMYHTGVDIPTKNSFPEVKSVCNGEITYNTTNDQKYKTEYSKYWNSFVVIKHDCNDDGKFDSVGYYGHLISNKSGSVSKGEVIGKIRMSYDQNNNPSPSNNHLHFGYNKNLKDNSWGYFGNTCQDVYNAGWGDPISYYQLN